MKKPLIYLITDGSLNAQNYFAKSAKMLELIEVAAQWEISMIQIREKNLPARLLFQLTQKIVSIRKKFPIKFLVNDRADIALAAKADGVHLTANSILAKTIRQNFPKKFVIGVSTHTLSKVVQAKRDGADFAVFSPIFSTPNKGEPQGVEKLSELVKSVGNFPIIALGGINEDNFADALNAGASGIAAIRMLNNAENIAAIVKKVRGKSDE